MEGTALATITTGGMYEWSQLQTVKTFARMKRTLRKLFLAHSCKEVEAVDAAFRLTEVKNRGLASGLGLGLG